MCTYNENDLIFECDIIIITSCDYRDPISSEKTFRVCFKILSITLKFTIWYIMSNVQSMCNFTNWIYLLN